MKIPRWLNPARAWHTRYRLPFRGKTASVGMTVILLLAAVVGLIASFAATSHPIFCSSCHEMDTHFRSWQVSSHKDVPCETCHVSPGLTGMFRTKLGATRLVAKHVAGPPEADAIKGHVPDVNCKKCHKTAREWVVYHGLKISHKQHWDRGINCTFCHADVVHGPNAATINVPRMEMCFKCHDGKQASKQCNLCHETLGERRPSTFTPEWVAGHRVEVSGDSKTCMRCHQTSFCDNCHKMSNPHDAQFMSVHADEYRRNRKRCEVCHSKADQKSLCDPCHALNKGLAHTKDIVESRHPQHPADWLKTHPETAKADIGKCNACHTNGFCVACHTSGGPASHKQPDWMKAHKAAVAAGVEDCSKCHTQSFCAACHRTSPPQSHKVDWKKRHGVSAQAGSSSCGYCHQSSQCSKCHGLPMPHPASWRKTHPSTAKSNRSVCSRCHTQSYCNDCHGGARPASHSAANWGTGGHAPAARANPALCSQCHSGSLCQACHSTARPASHSSKDFMTGGHGALKKSGKQNCSFCHKSQKFCDDCHKNQRPASHTATWMATHGKPAASDKANCGFCHDRSLCSKCHGEGGAKPSSHGDSYLMGHAKDAKARLQSCALCHASQSCNTCHKALGKPEMKFQ